MDDREWLQWAKTLCGPPQPDDPVRHHLFSHCNKDKEEWIWISDGHLLVARRAAVGAPRFTSAKASNGIEPAFIVKYLAKSMKPKGSVDRLALASFVGPYGNTKPCTNCSVEGSMTPKVNCSDCNSTGKEADDYRPAFVLGQRINRELLAKVIGPMTANKLALWRGTRAEQMLIGGDGETRFMIMGLHDGPDDTEWPSWPPKAKAEDQPGAEQ